MNTGGQLIVWPVLEASGGKLWSITSTSAVRGSCAGEDVRGSETPVVMSSNKSLRKTLKSYIKSQGFWCRKLEVMGNLTGEQNWIHHLKGSNQIKFSKKHHRSCIID